MPGRDAAEVAFLTNYGWLQTVDMQVWVGERPDEVTAYTALR